MQPERRGEQNTVEIIEDQDGEVADVDQGEESQGSGGAAGRQALHQWQVVVVDSVEVVLEYKIPQEREVN